MATWWKTTTRFSLIKTKIGFTKPCFLTLVHTVWKIDCTKIIHSFKDMFDVSHIVLQNTFETSPPTDASHETSVFWYTAAVDFIQQPVQTQYAHYLTAENPIEVAESEILVAHFCEAAPLCIINLMKLEFTDVLRTKRHWNLEKKLMQIGQTFWRFVSSQM